MYFLCCLDPVEGEAELDREETGVLESWRIGVAIVFKILGFSLSELLVKGRSFKND